MSRGYKTYDTIREDLNLVRSFFNSSRIITEDTSNENLDTIPYTKQDELYNSIIETCKSQFGADFSKVKNPMLYFPQGEDVKLSGEIPLMDNAKFQFSFKESEGCQIWLSPLKLTDDTLDKIRLILGVYKNWKKEVLQYGDYKPVGAGNKVDDNQTKEEQPKQLQPGDDAEMA